MPISSLPAEIDVQSVKSLLETGEDFLLIDCREPDEFNFARIQGSRLIPMQELPSRLSELEPFREKRIVTHCHHGGRSKRVTDWLRQQGFSGAQNMTGGIDAWSLQVDPTLPRY